MDIKAVKAWLGTAGIVPAKLPPWLAIGKFRLTGAFTYNSAVETTVCSLMTGANWTDKRLKRQFNAGNAFSDTQIAEYSCALSGYDIIIGWEAALANEEPADLAAVAASLFWRFENAGANTSEDAFHGVRWLPFWNTGVALTGTEASATESAVVAGITPSRLISFQSGPYIVPLSGGEAALKSDGTANAKIAANAAVYIDARGAFMQGTVNTDEACDCTTPEQVTKRDAILRQLGLPGYTGTVIGPY